MDPRVSKSQEWALCMSLLVSHYISTIKFISISGSQHVQSIYYDYSDIKNGGGCGARLRNFTNIEPPLCTDINTRGIMRLSGGPRYHQWHFYAGEWWSSQLAFLMVFNVSPWMDCTQPWSASSFWQGQWWTEKPQAERELKSWRRILNILPFDDTYSTK